MSTNENLPTEVLKVHLCALKSLQMHLVPANNFFFSVYQTLSQACHRYTTNLPASQCHKYTKESMLEMSDSEIRPDKKKECNCGDAPCYRVQIIQPHDFTSSEIKVYTNAWCQSQHKSLRKVLVSSEPT